MITWDGWVRLIEGQWRPAIWEREELHWSQVSWGQDQQG